MSGGADSKFSCASCGRQFAWKPALAGKRAKCGCGEVLTIPEAADPSIEQDLYDLAPDKEAAAARPAVAASAPAGKRLPLAPKRPAAEAPSSGGYRAPATAGAPTLGYQRGPTQKEKEIYSRETLVDMKRDIYAPSFLLVLGFALSIGYQVLGADNARQAAATGLVYVSMLTAIKAVMLMIFAFFMAGPLGVSFGGVGTAALKLAAMAVFCDGATAWIDAGVGKMTGTHGGAFNGIISFPIALFIYWQLLIHLFSMDAGDSWFVVFVLTGFSWVVQIILSMALVAILMNGGGGTAAAIASGAPSAAASSMTQDVADLKDSGHLQEARAYIAGGRQAALTGTVEALYAAGCPNVWFEVSKDINGRMTPLQVIAELPPLKEKDKRDKSYQAVKKWYTAMHAPTDELVDDGDPYLFVDLRP